MTFDAVVGPGARVGEGARWDERAGVLWWVDIPAERIHRFDPSTGENTTIDVGRRVGSVALRADGGIVACTEHGVEAVDWEGGRLEPLVDVCGDDPDLRCNDAGVDAVGRLWIGTMSMTFRRGAGALHRVDADGRTTRVLDGLDMPNGLGWSPDGTVLYLIDTFANFIWSMPFDADRGAVGDRTALVRCDARDGLPDGMAVDADGRLWVAWFRGAAVRVFEPNGSPAEVVPIPTWQVTSVAFGGAALDELFVTSASEHLTDEQRAEHPLAGALFRGRPGASGVAAKRFAG